MAAFSDYLENQIINFWLRGDPGALTAPPTVYVALFTASPGDAASTASEVTQATNAYARQSVAFGVPSVGVTSNVVRAEFVNMPPVTVTHFGIFDSGTYKAGNMLYHGPLDANVTTEAGDAITFQPNALTITND